MVEGVFQHHAKESYLLHITKASEQGMGVGKRVSVCVGKEHRTFPHPWLLKNAEQEKIDKLKVPHE